MPRVAVLKPCTVNTPAASAGQASSATAQATAATKVWARIAMMCL
jgi:hypothetical protein